MVRCGPLLPWPALAMMLPLCACAGPRPQPAGPNLSAVRPWPARASQYPIDHWFVAEGRAPLRGNDAPRLARLKAERDLAGQIQTSISSEALYLVRQHDKTVQRDFTETTRIRAEGMITEAKVISEGPDPREGIYRVLLAVERERRPVPSLDHRVGAGLAPAPSPGQPTTVESSVDIPWPDDWTAGKARQAALDQARRKAIEHALGVEVRGDTAMRNDQIVEDAARSFARGRILTDTVLEEGAGAASSPTVRTYHLRLRAEVLPVTESSRRLNLRASLDKPLYVAGEDATLRVEAAEDAFLYLFNVGEDGRVTLFFPNRSERENRVRAHIPFLFPSDTLRAGGVRLRARLPAGRTRSAEAIKVLVVERPFSEFLSWSGTEADLMARLRKHLGGASSPTAPPPAWDASVVPFEVVTKGN